MQGAAMSNAAFMRFVLEEVAVMRKEAGDDKVKLAELSGLARKVPEDMDPLISTVTSYMKTILQCHQAHTSRPTKEGPKPKRK